MVSRDKMDYKVVRDGTDYTIEKVPGRSDDLRVLHLIKQITSRGNDAEVRRKKDGKLTVYEVKKNKIPVE